MPGASALVLPDTPVFTVVAVTDEFAAFGGTSIENMIGNSIFKYFPDNPDAPNVSDDIRASFLASIQSRKRNELAAQRYDIANEDGTFREMYWTVIHTPILDAAGEISFIIHTAVDVTDRILSKIKDDKIELLKIAHNLFRQASLAIHIYKGPDNIVELANAPSLRIWGKDESVIGKAYRDIVPESTFNKYSPIIEMVRKTGKTYQENESPIILHRNGKEETGYFNFTLQPYYEDGETTPVGVISMVEEVTDKVMNQKALEEKERSLELAVEIGDLGTFNIDLRNGIVNYSPQIMEWLNVSHSSMSLADLLKIIHPDDHLKVNDTLAQIINGNSGNKHDLTFRSIHPVTQEIQYLRSIGQVSTDGGEAILLSGIIQDITNSVQSRMALEQSAQRLRSFIDSAPFPIGVYIGKEMRIEMVNQSILNVWDKDSSVIGKRYAEVLPELKGQGIYEQLNEVYTSGKAFHAHQQRVDLKVDGRLQSYYFNYSFTPLFDSDEKVYGVMNTAADVTDLIVTQKALKESERNFRMMILQAPVAMCLLSGPAYIVEVANEEMITLWGKSEAIVMNKPVFEGMPDVKEQGLEQLLAHVYRTGETITANEHPVSLLRYGKTETVYLNFVYEPYRDGNGVIAGVIAIAIDVTDQVLARFKIEEMVAERTIELELTNTSLQQSNAELEQFAYIASHDLQEPLRKINMFTGMLQDSLDNSNDRAMGLMKNINNSVGRMSNLIRDVLSYSQLSRSQDTFEKTELEIVFADVVSDFDLIAEEKHAVITQSGLPVIEAIPLQMIQLFHNLISNALKYSRPDVPPVISISSVVLSADEAAKFELPEISTAYHKITFSDNGIGFSQEHASKIFNIFQRLHGKGQYEGTGIGLAMCKKIAENHHGTIYAVSEEGVGTQFTVILPERQG